MVRISSRPYAAAVLLRGLRLLRILCDPRCRSELEIARLLLSPMRAVPGYHFIKGLATRSSETDDRYDSSTVTRETAVKAGCASSIGADSDPMAGEGALCAIRSVAGAGSIANQYSER
jgi:hypothetical protein